MTPEWSLPDSAGAPGDAKPTRVLQLGNQLSYAVHEPTD